MMADQATRPPALDIPAGPLLGVYRQPAPVFVAGRGSHLIAEDGREYLDFTSGIGVNALGYGDTEIAEAIAQALVTGVIHTSNLYRTTPARQLARALVHHSFADSVFFCNSGAEANEGAFKFARRWASAAGGATKHEIVALQGAFHGRLFGSLAATDRPNYQAPFQPLMPGVRFVPAGDLAAAAVVIDRARTAAVIAEPIQGEGGVHVLSSEYLQGLRDLCTAAGALFILDEVQCGLGRTGHLFAHEPSGVVPDMVTLAKPLAGGLPMGAVLLSREVAAAIQPGDHATTFGGGPLVSTVALTVLRRITEASFLARVRASGNVVAHMAEEWQDRGWIRVARGRGLMWGLEIPGPAGDVVQSALEAGLLLVSAGERVIRLLPPLNITESDLRAGLHILGSLLA